MLDSGHLLIAVRSRRIQIHQPLPHSLEGSRPKRVGLGVCVQFFEMTQRGSVVVDFSAGRAVGPSVVPIGVFHEPVNQLDEGDLIFGDSRLCLACTPLGDEAAIRVFALGRAVLTHVEAVPVQLDIGQIAITAALLAVTGFAFGSCHGAAPMLGRRIALYSLRRWVVAAPSR